MKKILKTVVCGVSLVTGVSVVTNVASMSQLSIAYAQATSESSDDYQAIESAEKLDSEQIIVKITSDGFVTSHGDHFHYYNGTVPSDALFFDELLVKENYEFNEANIITEIQSGYIVKVQDDYFVYLTDKANDSQLRTVDEINLQAIGMKPVQAKAVKKLKLALEIDNQQAIVINETALNQAYLTEKELTEVPTLVYLTESISVFYINGNLYTFNSVEDIEYQVLEEVVLPENVAKNDVTSIKSLINNKIVQYKEQYYLKLANQSATKVVKIADLLATKSTAPTAVVAKNETMNIFKRTDKKHSGSTYTTSDGYVFTPESVIQITDSAVIVQHQSHMHYIPKSELSTSELQASYDYLASRNQNTQHHVTTTMTQVEITTQTSSRVNNDFASQLAKLYALPKAERYHEADGLVFDPQKVLNKISLGYTVQHEDHYHVIPFDKLSNLEIELAEHYLSQKTLPEQVEPRGDNENEVELPTETPVETTTQVNEESSEITTTEMAETSTEQQYINLQENRYLIPKIVEHSKLGQDGMAYETTDGYHFAPDNIIEISKDGVVGKHEEHLHFIPFADLEDFELSWLDNFWNRKDLPKLAVGNERNYINQLDADALNIKIDEFDFPIDEVIRKAARVYRMSYDEVNDRLLKIVMEYNVAMEQLILLPDATAIVTDDAGVEHIVSILDSKYQPEVEEKTDTRDYDAIEAALLLPVESLGYRLAFADGIWDHYFTVPHVDHYHYVDFAWLTNEEIATGKYLLAHPELKPKEDAGWGADVSNNSEQSVESPETMADWAQYYKMSEQELTHILAKVAQHYGVAVEEIMLFEERVLWVFLPDDSVEELSLDDAQSLSNEQNEIVAETTTVETTTEEVSEVSSEMTVDETTDAEMVETTELSEMETTVEESSASDSNEAVVE